MRRRVRVSVPGNNHLLVASWRLRYVARKWRSPDLIAEISPAVHGCLYREGPWLHPN
jgi:hypothetical protein